MKNINTKEGWRNLLAVQIYTIHNFCTLFSPLALSTFNNLVNSHMTTNFPMDIYVKPHGWVSFGPFP